MWGNVAKLQRAAEQLREVAAVLSIVDARLSMAHMEALGVPIAGGHAEEELHCAYAQLTSLANRADDVSALVRTAATSYGWAERFAENASRRVAADAAAVLGFFFPRWVALAALTSPALPVLAALGLAAHLLNSRGVELLPPGLVSAALNEYITDPAFVWALRHAVMSSDEFAAGASGGPPPSRAGLRAQHRGGAGAAADGRADSAYGRCRGHPQRDARFPRESKRILAGGGSALLRTAG